MIEQLQLPSPPKRCISRAYRIVIPVPWRTCLGSKRSWVRIPQPKGPWVRVPSADLRTAKDRGVPKPWGRGNGARGESIRHWFDPSTDHQPQGQSQRQYSSDGHRSRHFWGTEQLRQKVAVMGVKSGPLDTYLPCEEGHRKPHTVRLSLADDIPQPSLCNRPT